MSASDASPAPPPAREIVAALAGALALAVLLTWPLALSPLTALIGSPFGEVDNHFWMYWRDQQGPGPFSNWPAGWEIPLMDPVNRVWVQLASPLGPVAAYNAVVFGNLVLAGVGGWALARVVTGSPHAAWVGLAATEAAPFLGGIVDFGITEALPIGWLALHLAAALSYLETGRRRTLVASGVCLAAFLASGWYHAVFALVAEAALATRWRVSPRRFLALVAVAAVAGATRIPVLISFRALQGLWSARFHGLEPPLPFLPDWRDAPRYGTDLLTFVLPRLDALPVSRTVFLGFAVLLPALLTRRRWLWAPTVALLVLALGHHLRAAGHVLLPGVLPAGFAVGTIPALAGISHWYRATGPAVVFLAAAAASGASRFPRFCLPLAALIVAESLLLSPTAFPRHVYRPDPPAALLALPDPGPVLELPIDDVGTVYDPPRSRRPSNQWQVFHGHAVGENYEGPDAALRIPGVAALAVACGGPSPRTAPAPGVGLGAALWAAGFRTVVVYPRLTRPSCATAVAAALGPGADHGDVIVWALGPP